MTSIVLLMLAIAAFGTAVVIGGIILYVEHCERRDRRIRDEKINRYNMDQLKVVQRDWRKE